MGNDRVLEAKGIRCGEKLNYQVDGDTVTVYFENSQLQYPLYTCPTTGWQYFYAVIPAQFFKNDEDLQPRSLRQDSLWALYRHFRFNTQISPSICRIADRHLLLFDGQHKAAAQIWAGQKKIECKIFVNPDPRVLKETNLEAHENLRQMKFYSHELTKKYADIFGEDWTEYMETEGEKSEHGFSNFLVMTKNKTQPQAKKEISLALYNEIVDDPTNELSAYLSEKSRTRKQPLTSARLTKAFFDKMLVKPPVTDEFESEADFRNQEAKNMVRLLNIVAEEGLDDKWNPERNDATHQKAERIFSAGAIRAWAILLRDTINQHLRHYTDAARKTFLYREVSEEDFDFIRGFVQKIFSHKIWDTPDPAGELTARLARDNLEASQALFEEEGLTVSWVLGLGPE